MHLRGANGVGKTTLLKLIAGLYQPLAGQIHYHGQSIQQDRASYQKKLCYVGHKSGINPQLTLRENCLFDLQYADHNLEDLAKNFSLTAHLDKPCSVLSAGQRRQAGLLRLWMTRAPLWLLDEPLVALDDKTQQELINQLNHHREVGGAIILTSHQSLPQGTLEYQEYWL